MTCQIEILFACLSCLVFKAVCFWLNQVALVDLIVKCNYYSVRCILIGQSLSLLGKCNGVISELLYERGFLSELFMFRNVFQDTRFEFRYCWGGINIKKNVKQTSTCIHIGDWNLNTWKQRTVSIVFLMFLWWFRGNTMKLRFLCPRHS